MLGVGGHAVGESIEEQATVGRAHTAPGAVAEGLMRGLHGCLGVLAGATRHSGPRLRGEGVFGLDPFSGRRRLPAIADAHEEVFHNNVLPNVPAASIEVVDRLFALGKLATSTCC